jgi:hypothetical protein
MVSQEVTKPRTSATGALAWVMAVLGGAAAIIVYPGVLVIYVFGLALAELPPDRRASSWADGIRLLVFAVLPVLAAFLVGRVVTRRSSAVTTTAAVLWTIALTSALCFAAFAAYRVAWPSLP